MRSTVKTTTAQKTEVPTIFGMNFQAVSVGQKLVEKSDSRTGYLDAAGTPTVSVAGRHQVRRRLYRGIRQRTKAKGLYDSTLIVITAKHGQSPIDPSRYVAQLINVGTSPVTLLSNAGYIPYTESTNNPTGIGPTEDDVSLVWLNSPSNMNAAVKILEDNATVLPESRSGQFYYGPSLAINYNDPTS